MRSRVAKWILLCLLCVAGAWLFWRLDNSPARRGAAPAVFTPIHSSSTAPQFLTGGSTNTVKAIAAASTSVLAFRLSNTPKSIGELVNDPHAILLENALIDTRSPLDFSIPKHLQAQGDPGAYIVQSRGPITAAFRATLAQAGAEIVSYIPNDAYLVHVTAAGASSLAAQPLVQSVIPYEPYYKIQSSLLNAAVGQKPLPDGAVLNLGLLAGNATQTISQIEKLGGRILAQDTSPFGPVVRVQPPANWTALAALPGVQIVEPFHPRVHANDLSRVSTGVSTDTVTNTTYLGLSGLNVIVQVNDSGIDATHPDFTTGGNPTTAGGTPIRVIGLTTNDLVDTDGHGTFVAGEIAGNGAASINPTPVGAVLAAHNFGSVSNADFRGKAPLATLFAMSFDNSEQSMQEEAALTNALISNNSWNNDGDSTYSLDAASYDAATRDALPEVTGSQPVLFVFSAGNAGNGDDSSDPGGGNSDSIQSPATAKNVITVGAIQEERNITNYVTNADGTIGQPWLHETSTSYRIAGFSSRGNVGIGIEGTSGRFKPDVVAPGTFIVSTRSSEWATTNYFYEDPTNYDIQFFPGVVSDPDSLWVNGFPIVPNDAISVNITVSPNADSPNPFPTNPIYFAMIGSPFPGSTPPAPSIPNQVNIPPDGGFQISDILNSETYNGFNYAISNTTSSPMSFDLTTTVVTTNNPDNHLLVLSNLDNTIGPYYRFETGTSMSAADVSGVLALMEDFFTNTLQTTPSPALLKAMLINGARPTGAYNLQANNAINYEGWGLVNLPNSLPTNNPANFNGTVPSSIYIQDQSPTNALATGDTQTLAVTVLTNTATLHITLAWTDPPGNPAAAIKLVNSLELVVSNMDNPTNPVIFYGNDIAGGNRFNTPESPGSNAPPFDVINNVQNVIIQQPLGTNYSVTVIGRDVNVNAVSAQMNIYAGPPNSTGVFAPNVVQDYALVISSGNGNAPGSFTVADQGIVSNPTGDQDITFVATTNQPLMNQFVGASTPLLGTNTVEYGSSNELVTLGMTNQWHFYVVTNDGAINSNGVIVAAPNAGFVTFSPDTLSIPRMGVFAGSQGNATTPQADIDLYVTTDPTLANLNPVAISNCVNGTQIGLSVAGVFNGAALSRAGTEYVVDTNSARSEVYYIGVKSERQVASEYEFIPIFSSIPFSQMNPDGSETVNGEPVPANIPDGTPADPGVMNWVMGIALYPITVQDITATTEITHQNFGDLYGTLTHNDSGTGTATVNVLNNHDSWGSVVDQYFIYNDNPTNIPNGESPPNPISGPSDGPGSLNLFSGQDGTGVWQLTEVDDSFTQTGSVRNFTMLIEPHHDLTGGVTNTIPPHGVFRDFVDVPAGATNLTINATNITPATDTLNPLLMTIKFGSEPTLTDADKGPVALVNGIPPGNSLSVGPTDVPPIQPGRYYVDITNQSSAAQTVFVIAVILPANPSGTATDFTPTGSTTLLDDAVTNSDIFVTNTEPIVSLNVGIVVQHPRISDLVFHLISPDGTRDLLMENRGGDSTNGAGAIFPTTNYVNVSSAGGPSATTNFIDTGETSGSIPINYNMFTIPDEMTVYYSTNLTAANLITNFFASGAGQFNINFPPAAATGPLTSTYITIVMNATNHPSSTYWTYTFGNTQTNYAYLVFTEDTNLTTTPIKFAPPPFVPAITAPTNILTDGFEQTFAGDYTSGSTFGNGWTVTSNQVSVVTDPTNAYEGSNYLALASGTILTNLPTVAGQSYTLTFAYRGPDIAAWWRGESNANDSLGVNNGTLTNGASYTNGEVGSAFNLPGVDPNQVSTHPSPGSPAGPGPEVVVPYSSLWDFGSNNFTIDLWANFNVVPSNLGYGIGYPYDGIFISDDVLSGSYNKWWFAQDGPVLDFHINDPSSFGADFTVQAPFTPLTGQWYHFAVTRNGNLFTIYANGAAIGSQTDSYVIPNPNVPLEIGGGEGFYFNGLMDEVSVYGRALSASEVNAIYNAGTGGKFDATVFNTSPAQSLAEAQVSLNGQTQGTLYGSNTVWQTETITFTATQDGTPLSISGLEPGMLLDDFVLTAVPNDLYDQPEQSLDAFTGKSAYGDWQLEIQDDRAGAGLTNALVSWELQFVFANTNAVPLVLGGGIGQSNQFIPAGDIAWYQINVPSSANFATNLLLFASAPVNFWFDTNNPPTTNILLINGTSGSILMSTTNPPDGNVQLPPNIYDGQTYYLGVQNTGSTTINYGIKVNFDLAGQFSSLLLSSVAASGSGTSMKWTAAPSAQFQIQWKDGLTQPWNTDPNIITSSSGNFTFTDNGSQTAPMGTMRFYRLVRISP